MDKNILLELKKNFIELINKESTDFLFKNNINRFSKLSIIFNKNILIDFSKNFLNQNTIKILINLFEDLNLFNFLKIKYFNIYKDLKIDFNIIDKIIFIYKKMILYNKNIKNIIFIMHNKHKFEFDIIYNSLKFLLKKNYFNIYFMSFLTLNNYNLLNSINIKNTIFILSYESYRDEKFIELITYIKNKYNYKDNIILISSDINNYINIGININNLIILNKYIYLYFNSIYYISIAIIVTIGLNNFNNLISGILLINNNFLNKINNKIYENVSVILSLIDIWNLFFFKTNINLLFNDYRLFNFIDFYNFLHINNSVNDNFNNNLILGSSNIYIQNFMFNFFNKYKYNEIYYEFIGICNNDDYIFENNNDKYISNLLFKSRSLFFNNFNFNKIDNILFNNKNINNLNNNIVETKIKNIPNNFILLNKLNSINLGIILYMYKYRVFTKCILFNFIKGNNLININNNIYNYDKDILNLKVEEQETNYDYSTNNLINFYKKNRFI